VPPTQAADELKISDMYKFEEFRLLTSEEETVKLWTYEFKGHDLYLDSKIFTGAKIQSTAVCKHTGLISIISGSTVGMYNTQGSLLHEIENEPFTQVGFIS